MKTHHHTIRISSIIGTINRTVNTKNMTIYITALMKVVGIQAKDGTLEVAIGKEEAERATEVIGKGILEDKMNMVG